MAATFKDRAKHGYPFGFSKISEMSADERNREREDNRADELDNLRDMIEQLSKRNAFLERENEELKARRHIQKSVKSRTSSKKSSTHGRGKAPGIVKINDIPYWSMDLIAHTVGINVSNVTRQIAHLGIAVDHSTGFKRIPQSQVNNIKRRKR